MSASVAVRAAGVDTWSPCWYVDRDSAAAAWLDQLATVPTARAHLMPDAIAGHRVGWSRGTGMLFAEGHPGIEGLLCPDSLPAAFDQLVGAMREAGVPVPGGRAFEASPSGTLDDRDGHAGVRRLDATVDLAVSSAAEGLAIMAGVAAVARDAAGTRAEVWFSPQGGGVETVYMRGPAGKKVLGRWYDKGVESRTAPRGRLLRPEDQRRYVKGTRRDPSELTGQYVRSKFHQRFVPLWRASKGVTVAGPIVLAEKLSAAVEAGEVTMAEAERVAGHLLLAALHDQRRRRLAVEGRAELELSRATVYRRRALARELGLVLADGVLQEVEVDLHDVLEQVLDAPGWTASGQG